MISLLRHFWICASSALVVVAFNGCGTVAPQSSSVQLTLNGAPAGAGDYKPKEIQSLVLANGLLSIAFGVDGNGDFSAISVM